MSIHESDRSFKCDLCNYFFPKRYKLKNHIEAVHEKSVPRLNCEFCSKTFFATSNLNKHVRIIHEGERRFKCDGCHKRFAFRNHLHSHLRTKKFESCRRALIALGKDISKVGEMIN